MRKRACLLIRTDLKPRWQAFQAGLQQVGFDVIPHEFHDPQPQDVLVIWNRHRHNGLARRFEQAGAAVIVSENGWVRRIDGLKTIALCRGHHNGAGEWPEGEEDRWSALGVELQAWRSDGEHVLVLDQRGIGEPAVAMPRGWTASAVSQLQSMTRRRIVVRRHPGNAEPPPEPDWRDCWAAVTWASGAGIKAIIAGVPVFYGLERWIGGPAARYGLDDIERPFLGDRLPMLHRLAYAQWTLEELTTGEPFARLLAL